MTAREPSLPPRLDGFQYVDLLGSGGFADVFRYRQLRPARDVAVKVLLNGLGASAQRQFDAEADLMALLSNHPSIVSIYASGVAGDGRPYLVMEMCQPGHLGSRIRRRPFLVGRALEIGVQIAGAVETAHRLGILHRDIKPANILFTEFGRPALTDFGISAAEGYGPGTAAFSVAWAPPEQIDNRPMGPTGDVYSLAATIWAMVVGHSPFEVPGDNGTLALTHRVRTQPVPPMGQAETGPLERILRTALAKDPAQRYATALDFARALQRVQAERHESVTTIDVRDERAADAPEERETGTRVTGFLAIDPDAVPSRTASGLYEVSDPHGTRPTGIGTDPGERRDWTEPTRPGDQGLVLHGRGWREAGTRDFTGPALPVLPDEGTRSAGPPAPGQPSSPAPARGRLVVPLVLVAVLSVGGLGALWIQQGGGPATTGRTPTTTSRPADAVPDQPRTVTGLRGVAQGTNVVFTWTNPDPKPGDKYYYRPALVDPEPALAETTLSTVTLPARRGQTCIEVQVYRSNGQVSDMATKCENT